ncbi:MAG: ATP synthase F0 subunit C [Chthonomonadales bacterium]|nr:ATP synthase F0 subunit C [Chthonomonadales bacterium]
MIYFAVLALAVGLGLPLAVIGGAAAQGRAAASALDGMARQPEAIGKIQTAMILGLAFIESLVIFTFVFLFLLKSQLPADANAVVEALKSIGTK